MQITPIFLMPRGMSDREETMRSLRDYQLHSAPVRHSFNQGRSSARCLGLCSWACRSR